MAAGINFEFLDADSLARARSATAGWRSPIPRIACSSSRRWKPCAGRRWRRPSAFAKAGGLVLSVGALPFASDRAGRDDKELDALVAATFPGDTGWPSRPTCRPMILGALTPDTRADKPVRSLHRKVGPRDVYMVMDAPKNSIVEFRAKGQVELWDPWTGDAQPLRVRG